MKKLLVSILFLSALSNGCSLFRLNENKFAVSISYNANKSENDLRNIRVVVGSDKFWWSAIKHGEKKSVNLYVKKNYRGNLSLIYEVTGKKMSWESENFTENSNYEIDLIVNSKGDVSKIIKTK